MADVDLHPWGWEVLSRFTARQLTMELLRRQKRRINNILRKSGN